MNINKELSAHCVEHWWNMGTKTRSFDGDLRGLLKKHDLKYTTRKTDREGIYRFYFSSPYGIKFQRTGVEHDFRHFAKQFIQMELVRMGDKSQLYVAGSWRPTVTVNH